MTAAGGDAAPPVPLAEPRVKRLAAQAGIPVPRGATAAAPGDLATAASGLAAPLVLKAFGPGIDHKSDVGAVRLGIPTPVRLVGAAEEMRAQLAGHGIEPAGFLVEEQAAPGLELIVGAVRDPSFGPVLLVGLGGIWAEALGDTALRLCPVTRADVEAMLAELRGAALLDGVRGRPGVHLSALTDLVLAVGGPGGLVDRLGRDWREFDLNPVVCTPEGATAVDARLLLVPGAAEPADLPAPPAPQRAAGRSPGPPAEPPGTDFSPLFAPRGIAVVGASASKTTFGNMFLAQYRALHAEGGRRPRLVAVHPEAHIVGGVRAVPSLADVPDDVDYALVAVPAAACADAVRAAQGIAFVQVMSGGFAEAGRAGARWEKDLLAAARESGTRMLGPNCMGVYSPAGGQTFLGGEHGAPGHISLVSQSGGLAGEVVKVGERRGLRFAKVATVGNCADVTPAELVRYLAADPDTHVLGLYLEDPRDGRALYEELSAARGRLPVVALVGGRSAQGRRAAASHTGAMVGDARVWRALARQCGVALVDGPGALIDALDFCDLHARRPVGGGPDVLVVGPSGGAGVLAADVFDAVGLSLGPLTGQARAALRDLGLGAGTPLSNPLEVPLGPRSATDLVRRAVESVESAATATFRPPFPDVVAHVNVQSFTTFAGSGRSAPSRTAAGLTGLLEYVDHIAALQAALPGSRVTLVLRNTECGPPEVADDARATARAAGVPTYPTLEAAAAAIRAGKTVARARSDL
ncbi:acyl-CoA synthetase (NDP forming) [Nocardiopsis mwathae]|uniref:Acyl-CoA synthetase (NDP forming) n=1 Tax=Nocardiopsis mwathae TaxID=1472723 RepID=A0A7W9YJZ2_9ACTN|nr:acetate--CoA ligase family protein [Nocardiopsis mwathae]MBB6172936.1 acyl-CoA synthetase (NDP forming) [Nocardiopsis mwathae]